MFEMKLKQINSVEMIERERMKSCLSNFSSIYPLLHSLSLLSSLIFVEAFTAVNNKFMEKLTHIEYVEKLEANIYRQLVFHCFYFP